MWISMEELLAKFVSCHENVKPPKLAGIPGLWEALGGALGKGGRICTIPKLWMGHDLKGFWLIFNHLPAGLVAYVGQQTKTGEQEWLPWGQSAPMGGYLPNLFVLQCGAQFRNTKCHFGQYFILRLFLVLESNLSPGLLVLPWHCFWVSCGFAGSAFAGYRRCAASSLPLQCQSQEVWLETWGFSSKNGTWVCATKRKYIYL